MARARLAEQLWRASDSDPVLLGTLRREWQGVGDVRDALWWHAHPLTDTPAGAPDPQAELRALQAAVYSREGSARGTADQERLQELMQERAGQARALADLLDRLAGAPAERDDLADLFGAPGGDRHPEPRTGSAGPAASPPHRQAIMLVGAGILLGVVGTLGVQAAVESPSSAPAPPLSFTAESAAPVAAPGDPVEDPAADPAFQIFSRPPAHLDHPLPFLGPDVIVDSIRPIDSFYSFDTYAARTTAGEYCLYVHGTARGITGGGCTTGRELLAHGSRSGITLKARAGDPDYPRYIDVTLSWLRDGSFQTDVAEADHP